MYESGAISCHFQTVDPLIYQYDLLIDIFDQKFQQKFRPPILELARSVHTEANYPIILDGSHFVHFVLMYQNASIL